MVRRGLEEPTVVDVVEVPPERSVLAAGVSAEVGSAPAFVMTNPPPLSEVAKRRRLSAERRIRDDQSRGCDSPTMNDRDTFHIDIPPRTGRSGASFSDVLSSGV